MNNKERLESLGIDPTWYMDGHASFLVERCEDPFKTPPENRVAFIEKHPRVQQNGLWIGRRVGDGHECGKYQPSRDWCEAVLIAIHSEY